MAHKPIVGGRAMTWNEVCQQALQTAVTNVRAQRIGSLWGRYGSVSEVVADIGTGTVRMIAKQVDPSTDGGSDSHDRKLKSYAVEAAFYSSCAQRVMEAGTCAISQPLLIDSAPPHFFFLLTDLRPDFPQDFSSYGFEEAAAALSWLAAFHALFWEEVPGMQPPISHSTDLQAIVDGSGIGCLGGSLWDQGCYWHLDTRQQEFRTMSRELRDLKAAAAQVDEVLKGLRADGSKASACRTLLHGDFKSENVLFDAAGHRCAAFDFQYCGEGLGAAKLYTYEVMVAHFDLCVVDYVRFMAGWGMWGNVKWAKQRTQQALRQLPAVVKLARSVW
eukprot:gene8899-9076_t